MELGNEERVDEKYAAKFEALAEAIWAKDRDVILVVGDFALRPADRRSHELHGCRQQDHQSGGACERSSSWPREHDREVWFDVHIGTDGPGPSATLKALPTYIDALGKLADGAKHKVVVFEYNAGNHAMRRALGERPGHER